jgi:hypothetical protein
LRLHAYKLYRFFRISWPLQPRVLVAQLLQLQRLGNFQPAVLLFPGIDRGVRIAGGQVRITPQYALTVCSEVRFTRLPAREASRTTCARCRKGAKWQSSVLGPYGRRLRVSVQN